MKVAFFLSALSLLFSLHESVMTLQNEIICEDVDLKTYIEFPFDPKCLQVVVRGNHNEVTCALKQFESFALLKLHSLETFKHRNVSTEAQENCQTFLIFAESLNDAKEIFESGHDHQMSFFPFSKIYFYIFKNSKNDSMWTDTDSTLLRNVLIRNALFGYVIEVSKDKLGFEVVIRDLLTNQLKQSTPSYMPSDLLHPFVDTRLAKDNFRISLFNCKPFISYRENASDETIIKEIDGIEFRFVKEVTKNWNKTYNFRDFSRTKVSPYSLIMEDLTNKSTDLTMCAIWLLPKYYESYDLTTFYDRVCSTFLVPKPIKLNEAAAIYTALHGSVWLLFFCFFVLSIISLNLISKLEKRFYQRHSQYTDFTTALIETINTGTSHSVHRFPSNDQLSLQIVLISWILFSVCMGISYTTVYTSRLTRPSYEKPVDTVKQFIEYGLHICSPYFYTDPIEQYRSSINEDHRKLSYRSLIYGEDLLLRSRFIAERKCVIFVNRPMANYVSFRLENDATNQIKRTFRIMDDCVKTQFTVFAFQKHSPFTKLFNWHIRRYQEHGIIQKWYSNLTGDQNGIHRFFDDNIEQDSVRQINIINVSGAFCLLFIGLLVSFVSFVLELIKYRRTFTNLTNGSINN